MLRQQAVLDSLCRLSWKQFEDLVGEAYRRQGYAVKEILGGAQMTESISFSLEMAKPLSCNASGGEGYRFQSKWRENSMAY
jgi:hypothetical protein